MAIIKFHAPPTDNVCCMSSLSPFLHTFPHILTPSHRASRPHCGGYSHPGGEDQQCGKGGEDKHHSNPLLTLHTLLTSRILSTQAAMESGFEDHIPCHTVTMACISSNAAIATGAQLLSISSSPLTPSPLTLTQVFVRLPRDRVMW